MNDREEFLQLQVDRLQNALTGRPTNAELEERFGRLHKAGNVALAREIQRLLRLNPTRGLKPNRIWEEGESHHLAPPGYADHPEGTGYFNLWRES